MTDNVKTTWIDHIPAIWIEPSQPQPERRLAVVLNGLSGTKGGVQRYLADLAAAGFYALSFDCWEHGERTSMDSDAVLQRTFGNFRRYMWVNIGQTALETLRVIDWAVETLGVAPDVCLGGFSMGGDIAVAAAGIDPRIRQVWAVGSTPDWMRPGMVDLFRDDHTLMPTGTEDAYSRWFYDQLNPITHLDHYAHAPRIRFLCGEKDDHVPAEAAFRFKAGLGERFPQAGQAVTVAMLPGLDHGGLFGSAGQWWPELLAAIAVHP